MTLSANPTPASNSMGTNFEATNQEVQSVTLETKAPILEQSEGEDEVIDSFDSVHTTKAIPLKKVGEQKALMDEKESTISKKEEKKDAGKTEKSDGEETEEKEPELLKGKEEGTKEIPTKPAKVIKGKVGDKEYELDAETEISVKVQGKYEKVSLQKLRDQYSGTVAIEREMTKIGQDKKRHSEELAKFNSEKMEVINHLQQIGSILDDKEKPFFEALHYIVDLSGRDPLEFNTKVTDYLQTELSKLEELTMEERRSYFKDMEVGFLRSKLESSKRKTLHEQQSSERVKAVDQLRDAHKISKSQYVEAHNELISLGYEENKLTADQVVRFAANKPFIDRADKLVKPYEGEISSQDCDALIVEVAKILKEYPHFSETDALSNAAKKLGFEVEEIDENLETVKRKVETLQPVRRDNSSKKVYKGRTIDDIEVFD
jgi:hypothetical protein